MLYNLNINGNYHQEYYDRIYGKIKIEKPAVFELIKSLSLQRLKKIDSAGYRPLWVNPKAPCSNLENSRFTHSLGVFILLKKYQAPFEEQIAGLIHDLSHSAFSHCIDYVLNKGTEGKQSHQDNIFKRFVEKTEIPSILKKYDFDVNYILNEKNFPLKEQPLPDLCADRIDYSLRNALCFEVINKRKVNYFLKNLTVQKKRWVFRDLESAQQFARLFLKMNQIYYAGLQSAAMFTTVGNFLKYALQMKYLNKNDLYTTDKEVLKKAKANLNKDKRLKLLWQRMNNKIKFWNDPNDYDAHVFCKSRVVDPLFKAKERIKRVSQVDKNWLKIVKRESQPKEYFIKFEK